MWTGQRSYLLRRDSTCGLSHRFANDSDQNADNAFNLLDRALDDIYAHDIVL